MLWGTFISQKYDYFSLPAEDPHIDFVLIFPPLNPKD